MAKCSECKENFPLELVQPICVDGAYAPVCGVCALEIVRRVHGIPTYMFSGEVARDIYERTKAIKDSRLAASTKEPQ